MSSDVQHLRSAMRTASFALSFALLAACNVRESDIQIDPKSTRDGGLPRDAGMQGGETWRPGHDGLPTLMAVDPGGDRDPSVFDGVVVQNRACDDDFECVP